MKKRVVDFLKRMAIYFLQWTLWIIPATIQAIAEDVGDEYGSLMQIFSSSGVVIIGAFIFFIFNHNPISHMIAMGALYYAIGAVLHLIVRREYGTTYFF